MTLVLGFRGKLFDDADPLYCTTTDGWVYDRTVGQWMTAASLAEAMTIAGYVPTTDFITPGVGGVEIGIPSTLWQDNNNEHPFHGSSAGGRDWGDPGIVFPTGSGSGGGTPTPNVVHGPYDYQGNQYWINSALCQVGFDVDEDVDPDIWMTGEQVCQESDISDGMKLDIHTKLTMHGCDGLMCVTDAGNLRKAFTQAHLNAGDE